MNELHRRAADRLLSDARHLRQLLEADELSDEGTDIALSTAKRVRREISALVRSLAQARDGARADTLR